MTGSLEMLTLKGLSIGQLNGTRIFPGCSGPGEVFDSLVDVYGLVVHV